MKDSNPTTECGTTDRGTTDKNLLKKILLVSLIRYEKKQRWFFNCSGTPFFRCGQQRQSDSFKYQTSRDTTDAQKKMPLPLVKLEAVLIMKITDALTFGGHRVQQRGWALPRRENCPTGRDSLFSVCGKLSLWHDWQNIYGHQNPSIQLRILRKWEVQHPKRSNSSKVIVKRNFYQFFFGR